MTIRRDKEKGYLENNMRKNLIKLFAISILGTTMMYGQATRTWVSGVGDDANPCSRTAPCKTWAGAISKTAPGGEIDALDPGGFGAVTITKAITLDGGGGQVAAVLVSGTNGIVVQAGANDVVILRNLRLNGISSGLNGIQFNSGKDLNVENCVIFGFTQNGINITLNQNTQASVHVIHTIIKNLTQGAASGQGVGIRATNAQTPVVHVGIEHSEIMLTTTGVEANANSRVVVSNTFVSHASADGVTADSNTGQVTVSFSDITFNTNGLTATNSGSANTAFSNYAYNSTCSLNNAGGGGFATFGNNRFVGAANCGTITGPIPQG